MVVSNFDKRLLVEQIRYMETEQPLACDSEEHFSNHNIHKGFEDRLWLRAQCLIEQHHLSSILGRAAKLSRYVKTLIFFVIRFFNRLPAVSQLPRCALNNIPPFPLSFISSK